MGRILDTVTHPDWWRPILTWPVFSATSYEMVRRLTSQRIRPLTILDVGANVGQFSVACAEFFPDARIDAFEPNPASAERLRKNIARYPQVCVHEHALGVEPGRTSFNVNSHSHSSSMLKLGESHKAAFPHAQEVSRIEVEVKPLDDVLQFERLQSPVLLKLDVQGFEPQVLAGASGSLRHIDYVLVETSFEPLYVGEAHLRDVQAALSSSGFVFDRPLDVLRSPQTGEILQMDALFTKIRT